MKYYQHLYIGESLKHKQDVIIEKLNHGQTMLQVYTITLPRGDKNHLEFSNSLLWHQDRTTHDDVLVVGLAGSYDEAVSLIEQITQEVYDATKGVNIRQYISDRQKEKCKK